MTQKNTMKKQNTKNMQIGTPTIDWLTPYDNLTDYLEVDLTQKNI